MKRSVVAIAFVMLAAVPAPVWLDAATPKNWNIAGAPIPLAGGPKDPDLAPGGRCAGALRPPSTPEDRAVVRKGWSLIGPYERYGRTSVLTATASADGMCRPNGFQSFVFVDNLFAGTLSPHSMDSRSDASISGLGIELQSALQLSATFARYANSDALCCPHASTNVTYSIVSRRGRSVVAPASAQTSKNSP